MFRRKIRSACRPTGRLCSALCLLSLAAAATAEPASPSFTASPGVYKVVAENEQYRVVLASWKPGQRDAPHSHPFAAVFFISDCALRSFAPDGTSRDAAPLAGHAVMQQPIAAHSVQNIGSSPCQIVMFEAK